jgi:CubicO group peptidase (beta-lactamase class C family)
MRTIVIRAGVVPALAIAATLLLPAMAALTAEHGRESDVEASARVDKLFEPLTKGVQPGAGVLVVEHGEIVHQAVYGYADVERRVPLALDSTFRLDSVSKQFSAMAVMILEQEGRLEYDDPISRFVPELATYPGVTVRHLLNHTGGLPEYYEEIVKISDWPSNADAAQLLGRMAKPTFAPGSRYEYSNPGYDMLGPIVEAASGMRFADFVRQRIFQPLGMKHSLVHDHTRPEVPRRVLGYDYDEKVGTFTLNDEDPLNGIVGSGGVFSTLGDMYLWDQGLYGEKLLTRSNLDKAYNPAVLNDGKKIDYGFGWRITGYRNTRRVSHGGSWVGFRSHIARHPGIGLTVVILSNRSDFEPAGYIDRITDIYLDRSGFWLPASKRKEASLQ